MILLRDTFVENGIFGTLRTDDDTELFKTLERAYPRKGKFAPKVPEGRYQCVRGVHQLSRGSAFETFEVVGVSGHWGILFHAGNTNKDSNGCILLGRTRVGNDMIGQSRVAFFDFMQILNGVKSFSLQVIGG